MAFARASVLAVAFTVLAGCALLGDDEPALAGIWVVAEIDGQPVWVGENTVETPYVEIGDGAMSGELGCNRGGATFTVEDSAFTPGNVETQTRLCDPIDLMFAENAMRDVLGAGRVEFSFVEGRMTWVASGRQIILWPASEPPP